MTRPTIARPHSAPQHQAEVRPATWRLQQKSQETVSPEAQAKASVFLLELPLGQEVFHRRPSLQYLSLNNHQFSSSVPTGLGGFSLISIYRFFLRLLFIFRVFLLIDSLSGFPPQSPVIGLGGFSLATWSFETHQLLYGARMFSLVSPFSSSVSQWVERFFTKLHSYLHLYIWRSSRLRGKAIVISWSLHPVIWSRRHPYFNRTATKFLHTHFVDPMKLSLTLQFYDVRAYLWSASSRGHGGGFLWRQGKRP